MKAEITVLAGDGIGPEITEHALKVLKAIEKKYNHEFITHDALFGGIAIDVTGDPYPSETRDLCKHPMLYYWELSVDQNGVIRKQKPDPRKVYWI